MKKYRVTLREILATTYEIEVEDDTDEEDVFDAVRCGEGIEITRDTEPMLAGEDDEIKEIREEANDD